MADRFVESMKGKMKYFVKELYPLLGSVEMHKFSFGNIVAAKDVCINKSHIPMHYVIVI